MEHEKQKKIYKKATTRTNMNLISKKQKNYFQNDVLMQDTLIATKWLSLMFPFNMCDINIFRRNVRPLGISIASQ